jgi:hypothetical protein
MITIDLTPDEPVQTEQVEETEVSPYDAGWTPFTFYKPIEYRILFENKTEFQNMGLLNKLRGILDTHLGVEDEDYFIDYTFNEHAEYGIQLYTEGVGWMVMMKLVDPDNELPAIKRIEKRIR